MCLQQHIQKNYNDEYNDLCAYVSMTDVLITKSENVQQTRTNVMIAITSGISTFGCSNIEKTYYYRNKMIKNKNLEIGTTDQKAIKSTYFY